MYLDSNLEWLQRFDNLCTENLGAMYETYRVTKFMPEHISRGDYQHHRLFFNKWKVLVLYFVRNQDNYTTEKDVRDYFYFNRISAAVSDFKDAFLIHHFGSQKANQDGEINAPEAEEGKMQLESSNVVGAENTPDLQLAQKSGNLDISGNQTKDEHENRTNNHKRRNVIPSTDKRQVKRKFVFPPKFVDIPLQKVDMEDDSFRLTERKKTGTSTAKAERLKKKFTAQQVKQAEYISSEKAKITKKRPVANALGVFVLE